MVTLQNVGDAVFPAAASSSVFLAETQPSKHPIHHLPPELLSGIFWHALPVLPHPHPSEAPCNVSATCKTWRILALSTPSLWAHISIGATDDPVALRPAHIDILETWISRSGLLPLSISLKVLYKSWGVPYGTRSCFENVTRTISGCRSRWGALSLHLPITYLRMIFESGDGEAAPKLRELRVEESEFYLLSTVYVEFQLDRFPALESVNFFGCSSRLKAPRMPPPRTKMICNENFVSRLRFARVGLAHHPFELLLVLAHSPVLEDLQVEITISLDFGVGRTWKDPIHLPRLSKLWLQFLAVDVGRYNTGLIFAHLFTPNLSKLMIADSGSRCSDLLQGLPDFLTRNRPPIHLFSFEKFVGNADREKLMEVLRLLPSLKELKLHLNTFLNVAFLTALDRANGPSLLSNLEIVNLDAPSGFVVPRIELRTDVFGPVLMAMVDSRRGDLEGDGSRRNHGSFCRVRYNGQDYLDVDAFLDVLREEEGVGGFWRTFPRLHPRSP